MDSLVQTSSLAEGRSSEEEQLYYGFTELTEEFKRNAVIPQGYEPNMSDPSSLPVDHFVDIYSRLLHVLSQAGILDIRRAYESRRGFEETFFCEASDSQERLRLLSGPVKETIIGLLRELRIVLPNTKLLPDVELQFLET